MRLAQPISRRRFLAGVSVAAMCSPAHAQAETASDGFRVVRARPLGPGGAPQTHASVSSYDGTVPGPTLRIKRGEDLRVRVINEARRAAAQRHGWRAGADPSAHRAWRILRLSLSP